MSVIVDGMKMPESCYDCVTRYTFFRELHCDELKGMAGPWIALPYQDSRHPDCPLRPAPEWISVDQHGPVDSGWYWAWIVEPGYDEGEMVPSYYYARYDEWQSIECGIACSLPNHSILRIMPMQFPEPPTEKEPDQ